MVLVISFHSERSEHRKKRVFILEAQPKTSKGYISMVIGSNLFKSGSFKFYGFAKVLKMSKMEF
jgi:hypothetical protein